tara:strand:- start:28985 stop:29395 length:411 start_codon:yes stop_codon:yes gene_type:complete
MEEKRKMIRKTKKPTKKMLLNLALNHAGCVTDVALACHVERQTVYAWMSKDPQFKQAMNDGNDVLVDLAIKGLKHNLEQNNERSVHYTLDRLARDKGFGQLIKIQDKSKFEDQFDDFSDDELEALMIKTAERIKNG